MFGYWFSTTIVISAIVIMLILADGAQDEFIKYCGIKLRYEGGKPPSFL